MQTYFPSFPRFSSGTKANQRAGRLVRCFGSVLNPVLNGRELADLLDVFRHSRIIFEHVRVVAVNFPKGVGDHEVGPSDLKVIANIY